MTKTYPKYKESGVSWFGDVPSHWQTPRLGAVLRERKETNKANEVTKILSVMRDIGVIPYEEKGNVGNKCSEDITRYKIVRPGDIVANCMNIIIGSVGLSKYTGCLSPVYYVLTPRSQEDDSRFFDYVFKIKPFQLSLVRLGNGIMAHRMRIPMELLKCEMVPKPPAEDQKAIVEYLDVVNKIIRRYIREKQKIIKLLNEQKKVIINHAVTGGINPNVRFKSSGVDWIGDIPEHWEVRHVKHVSTILRGKFTHRPRNDPAFYDGPYPFIQTGEVARANKVITAFKQTLNERGLSVSKMFPAGTLVMTIAANIGDVAILDFEACFPDSVVGFVPRANIDRDFLFFMFKAMKSELLCEAPVNTQGNLNINRIGSRIIVLPPEQEQKEIVRHIESSISGLDQVIVLAQKDIDLIREYRIRLVSDVATGKIDVRDAKLPEIEDIIDSEPIEEGEVSEEIEDIEEVVNADE